MNPINFAKTAPAQRQQEINRWRRFTIYAMCTLLLGSCYLLFPPVRSLISTHIALRDIQRQVQSVPKALLVEQQSLKTSIAIMKKKHDALKKWCERPRLFLPQIDGILSVLGEKDNLESIKIDLSQVTMDIACASTPAAMELPEKLARIAHFSHVRLVSIQATNATLPIHATLRATCKKE